MGIIRIGTESYEVIDSSHRISMADSSVCRQLKTGSGNGERKIYFNSNQAEFNEIFGKDRELRFLILKSDFLHYLEDAKEEFENPTQNYRNIITPYFNEMKSRIDAIDGVVSFSCTQSAH